MRYGLSRNYEPRASHLDPTDELWFLEQGACLYLTEEFLGRPATREDYEYFLGCGESDQIKKTLSAVLNDLVNHHYLGDKISPVSLLIDRRIGELTMQLTS